MIRAFSVNSSGCAKPGSRRPPGDGLTGYHTIRHGCANQLSPLPEVAGYLTNIAAPKTPALSPSVGFNSAASNVGLKIAAVIFSRAFAV